MEKKVRTMISLYMIISGIVILLMMIFGLLMLLEQGKMISIGQDVFYKVMTAMVHLWSVLPLLPLRLLCGIS